LPIAYCLLPIAYWVKVKVKVKVRSGGAKPL